MCEIFGNLEEGRWMNPFERQPFFHALFHAIRHWWKVSSGWKTKQALCSCHVQEEGARSMRFLLLHTLLLSREKTEDSNA